MTEIVWSSVLDNRYECAVERVTGHTGQLKVKDTTDGTVLLEKEVGPSYGAAFGPDVADVCPWEDLCVDAVDSRS